VAAQAATAPSLVAYSRYLHIYCSANIATRTPCTSLHAYRTDPPVIVKNMWIGDVSA
jgi:cobalamin biosynthesis protein CbiG